MEMRFLIRRDVTEVCRIDRLCFQSAAMGESDVVAILRKRNSVGMVAVDDVNSVIGYVVYALQQERIEILRLAVHPLDQRQGVGTSILNRLVEKLEHQRRQAIVVSVADCETDCLLWLQRRGFVATDCGADKVTMTWSTVAEWRQWRVPVGEEVGER